MYYKLIVRTYIRVSPDMFGEEDIKNIILKILNSQFNNYISEKLGIIIGVDEVMEVGEGVIIPGDGSAYYDTKFSMITFKPDLQEVVLGEISDITDFGAFINLGAIEGMIHVSQAMDDFVSFSKSNVLTGKESKKVLKVGDKCRARIIAISYKDLANPKVGLTMRQPYLGALQWLDAPAKKIDAPAKKIKAEAKEK
ncbi:DNA-directed RNA polymerase [Candidatus Woesearchaeota archaeon]|nr:DNA-directed RNA polymerase [Candidatus Woesearchaeota archaeon]